MDKKRKRGDNWTREEKELFIEIMRQSSGIIESKNTDTNSNKQKHAEWQKVEKKFKELSGKSREISQLKGVWRRIKMTAKKNVQNKKLLCGTGGGAQPPSPPEDDIKIMEICPTDFIIEENTHDSDGFSRKSSSHKSALSETNLSIEERNVQLLEAEYALKLKYQRRELSHQKQRHKLEIDILMLDKEKKELEIAALRKSS